MFIHENNIKNHKDSFVHFYKSTNESLKHPILPNVDIILKLYLLFLLNNNITQPTTSNSGTIHIITIFMVETPS